MTTTKHTPGPWLRGGHNLVYTLENGVNEMTIQIHHRNGGTDLDARLIAAAPALLEALEALLAVEGIIDPTDDECAATQSANDKARAAIKLARGEP